jgi:uncharacterized protein (TIGR02996 family)
MDEQAFIAGIADATGDNALRLVFSDWLEENGQSDRAELIRVQIALADPPEDLGEYRALRAREAKLLMWHEKKVIGPLKKLGVRGWRVRRGLVDWVLMSVPRFVKDGEQVLALTPVQSVKLTGARRGIDALAACPALARVRGLDLSNNGLGEAHLRTLLSARLAELQQLDLSDNSIRAGGVRALADSPHLPALRRLALQNVDMGEEGARALAGHIAYPRKYARSVNLAGLVALDLRRNVIYEEGVTELAHSPHLAGLTELSLSPLWGKDVEALEESRFLKSLTVLRISGKDFSEGIDGLLECSFIKRLRVLELAQTGAEDRHAETIADCRHLGKLEHLNLGGNRITDDGLLALASRGKMPRLRWLELRNNQITSTGVRALCDSPLVSEVRELNLAANQLTDDAARAIAKSKHFPHLCGLSLNGNQIGDEGATALARSPLLQQLEELNLAGNPIGETGGAALCRAAHEAGISQRGGNTYWVEYDRTRREPLREREWG